MNLFFLPVVAALAFFAPPADAQAASQGSNDPSTYFGGVDHQPYLDWVDTISDKYEHSIFIPSSSVPSKGAAVHWSIVDNEWLDIAVAAPALGWVGFGISEAGGMHGADMAIFVKARPNEILDAHVLEVLYPQVDECQQDWIYVNHHSTSESGTARQATTTNFLMFEARRKLDTGDLQDKIVGPDGDLLVPSTRVIAAWGDQEDYAFHGQNVARGAIRFHGDLGEPEEVAFAESMSVSAEGSFYIGSKDYIIPSDETTYTDFCFSRADLIAQGVPDTTNELSIIGFEPVVSEASSAYVHHFVVTAFMSSDANACEDEDAITIVYVWAPGAGPFELPGDLGTSLFGSEGFQGFNVEIHYNNPTRVASVVDSSGVNMYYTSQVREIEVGVLEIGDPFVSLFGQSVGDGVVEHSFECGSSCSNFFMEEGDSVTVIREHLHMHKTGTRATNELIRNGETIRSGDIEVWDFDQNGNAAVQQEPFEIKAGDGFRTTCYYRSSKAASTPIFGLGSEDEMCIAFLFYYPKKSIANGQVPWLCGRDIDAFGGVCNSEYESSPVTESDLSRVFGSATCSVTEPPAGPPGSTSGGTSIAQVSYLSFILLGVWVLM